MDVSNGYIDMWNEANAAGARYVWPAPWYSDGNGGYEIWMGDEEWSPQVTWDGSSWVMGYIG